jgi:PKD domain-containing protein/thrombospondin type 3 repeat protein
MSRRLISVLVMVGAVGLSACTEGVQDLTMPMDDMEEVALNLPVIEGNVVTPSGVIFDTAEWALMDGTIRKSYLVQEEYYQQQVEKFAGKRAVIRTVGGSASLHSGSQRVLCDASYICALVPALVPGVIPVTWSPQQFEDASVADFAQFDMIFLGAYASGNPGGVVASRDTWGAAISGRVALTGMHFEHCVSSVPNGPRCRVLTASTNWILAGSGTGLLVGTQLRDNPIMPTFAPFNAVEYAGTHGTFRSVRIQVPGHPTMQGSSNHSLSDNTGHAAHSIFRVWERFSLFTQVAAVCGSGVHVGTGGSCASNVSFPYFLVMTIVVPDRDGDGVPDNVDNCPTVSNAGQADTNTNGVGDACESAPSVVITPVQPTVAPGATVIFSAAATDADDPRSSLTYEWRVDGVVQAGATGKMFSFSFTANATVRVTVRDPGNLSGFDETDVTVVSNQPPVAAPGGPYEGNEGSPVMVDGSGSSDPDGDPLTYQWQFDNGNSATGVTAENTWDDDGSYMADLTVTDPSGAYSTQQATVTIHNVAPTVVLGAMSTELTLDASTGSGSFSDPGVDTWTVTVDYGDGSPAAVTANAPEGAIALSHAYAGDGNYTVTVRVDDGDGGVTDATTTAEILNRAPSADASGSQQLTECTDNDGGTSILLVGVATDLDGTVADGDHLWTDGGGNVIATGANASVQLGLGTHVITLTVTDDDGASGSDEVTIVVEDTTAPTLSFGMDVTEIWPPNHKMVTVASGIGTWDACDGNVDLEITVESNESANDLGDGNTEVDWVIIDNGDGTWDVQVRAERQGAKTGRIYTITVTATDASGNVTTDTGTVTVPHDKGNGKKKGR